jgi:hypothetical protein
MNAILLIGRAWTFERLCRGLSIKLGAQIRVISLQLSYFLLVVRVQAALIPIKIGTFYALLTVRLPDFVL